MEFKQLRQQQLLFTIFLSALIISPSFCVKIEILNTICSQTQNTETCVQMLLNDSLTISASLPELLLISLDITSNQAIKNCDIFDKLMHNTTDEGLTGSYRTCRRIYILMTFKLVDAYGLAKQRRYSEIHQLGEAKDAVYRCENSLPVNQSTAAISEDMILTCETSASVISYLETYFPWF